MTYARTRLTVLALVAALGLAGCGGGGGGDAGSEAASEATSEATSEAASEPASEAASEGTGADYGASGASVAFAEPTDGATVTSPVAVTMQATGLTIEPAGTVNEGAGHFHIMIDTACVTPGEVIPNDDTHKHFGMAQTETELELAPGEHTLCLQAGDGAHTALDLTDEITVTVS